MSSGYYCSSYDRYMHQTDDSKAHKIKTAYWTTKQAMIKKFRRKQDESIVASDADLDSKLELLKSVQNTCSRLTHLLTRYQETVCYLSQVENEMGRFLKRYSLEDKTQAGKIMEATGKALSHSAQQRLLLRSPLDRLYQEVGTFRQRAISDTVNTLNRMETARTEYRGALLWMKHVSEELDPDTHKQLEKFRRVQAQVRKSKSVFDKLKIDSMQKIDLLSASRCNMLSHALVAYQNSLLLFLEKTSRAMMAVSDRFRGYQYYEFSILKQLRPESKKLAGLTDDCNAEDSAQRNSGTSSDHRISEPQPSEEELDKRLDDIFRSDDVDTIKLDDPLSQGMDLLSEHSDLSVPSGDLLAGADGPVPQEHRDLLVDLFAPDSQAGSFNHQCNRNDVLVGHGSSPQGFETELNSLFAAQTKDATKTPIGEDDEWNEFQMSNLSTLPSALLDQHDGCVPPTSATSSIERDRNPNANANDNSSSVLKNRPGYKPSSLDAWMSLFSDLGQVGNPDLISKNEGQVTDA